MMLVGVGDAGAVLNSLLREEKEFLTFLFLFLAFYLVK